MAPDAANNAAAGTMIHWIKGDRPISRKGTFRTGAHGDADVGRSKCGRIVDAVARDGAASSANGQSQFKFADTAIDVVHKTIVVVANVADRLVWRLP